MPEPIAIQIDGSVNKTLVDALRKIKGRDDWYLEEGVTQLLTKEMLRAIQDELATTHLMRDDQNDVMPDNLRFAPRQPADIHVLRGGISLGTLEFCGDYATLDLEYGEWRFAGNDNYNLTGKEMFEIGRELQRMNPARGLDDVG